MVKRRRARDQTLSPDKRSRKVRRISIEDPMLDVSSVSSTTSSSATLNSIVQDEVLVPTAYPAILSSRIDQERESFSIKFGRPSPGKAKAEDAYAIVNVCEEPQPAFDAVMMCDDFDDDVSTKKNQRSTRKVWQLIALLMSAIACSMLVIPRATTTVENKSICVSGGGFSGFWFTLGRLESLSQAETVESNFYCYSAGCLGVVARMKNYTLEDMYSMASSCQNMWNQGEITRYEVVERFVNKLIASDQDQMFDAESLSRLNVLTTVKDSTVGWRTSVRTPNSMNSLRKMLIQSAWIPFAVGSGLWHHDHMDGAFSLHTHPRCEKDVGLIWDFDLMSNVVNVNMGRGAVGRLWRKGIAYGI